MISRRRRWRGATALTRLDHGEERRHDSLITKLLFHLRQKYSLSPLIGAGRQCCFLGRQHSIHLTGYRHVIRTTLGTTYQGLEHLQVHIYSLQPEIEVSHGAVRHDDARLLTQISGPELLSSQPHQSGLPPPLSVTRGHEECCVLAVLCIINILITVLQSSHPSGVL